MASILNIWKQPYQRYSSPTQPSLQGERLRRIDDVCQSMKVPGTVKSLYFYHNVSYCINYKAASTYWLQIFRYLHGDVTTKVMRPSEIGKFETHLVKTRKIRLRHFFSTTDHKEILSSFRFMSTRDPYARLWSVYVDKFILLDNFFWNRYAPEIRRYNLDSNVTTERFHHAKIQKALCLDDIKFEEFLSYVATKGKMRPENLDDHMRPIHYGCNPCFYKPDFVCKVESMTHEKTFILQKLGLDQVDNIGDFTSHVMNEISMITDFEFKMWSIFKTMHRDCVTAVSLEQNMIRAFITNGYLPENVWKQFQGLFPLGLTGFKSKVKSIFLTSSRNASIVKEQRDRLRSEAYKKVPVDILHKIKDIFKYDFALFGYDPSPGYIFESR